MGIHKYSNRRTRHGVFEISSGNGLIGIYALRRAGGKGRKPDPKLETVLTRNAQRLKEKQEMAKLESNADTAARSKTDKLRDPASSPSNSGEAHRHTHLKTPCNLNIISL